MKCYVQLKTTIYWIKTLLNSNSIVDIAEYLCEKWVQYNIIFADYKLPANRSELLGRSTSYTSLSKSDIMDRAFHLLGRMVNI